MSNNIVFGKSGLINTGNTCYMNSAIQAFSHLNPLTKYFFQDGNKIMEVLLDNAGRIFEKEPEFALDNDKSLISKELRTKLHSENYNKSMLNETEKNIVLTHTMTFHLIKLLRVMWDDNKTVNPTSFRTIFTKARNRFFLGFEQHDAEEAYSCVLQKIQEELSTKQMIKFVNYDNNVSKFIDVMGSFKNMIDKETDLDKKMLILKEFDRFKKTMPRERIIIESFEEMKKYYDSNFCKITDLFAGFMYSKTVCPECKNCSNKFDPYFHLPLEINFAGKGGSRFMPLTLEECFSEYCKEEVLDQDNLWNCDSCKNKVKATKKISIWTNPQVLVIQLKRFGSQRLVKDSRMVKYPLKDLDISNFISEENNNSNKLYKYTLQCVINHTGGLNGGHYYTYARDEDTNIWYNYNDTTVTPIAKEYVVTASAYILYYIRNDLLK